MTEKNEKKWCVYMHKNKINGKVYIGQTSMNTNDRWRNGMGYKGCILFERAINKYGWDNFDHIIIADNLTQEDSCKIEIDLIAQYNSTNPQYGYNISSGGDSGHKGVTMSEAARQKISNANKNRVVSTETKTKISKALKGRSLSEEHKQKMSENKGIPVVQLSKEGKFIKEYKSAEKASQAIKISSSCILSVCNNPQHNKSAGGVL